MKYYSQADVWAAIQKRPGIKAGEIAQETGIKRRAVTNALQELRRRDLVRREGYGNSTATWYAQGSQPYCKWGTNANSLRNLHINVVERLARMGTVMKPPEVPVSSDCALQDCWGLSLIVRTLHADDR